MSKKEDQQAESQNEDKQIKKDSKLKKIIKGVLEWFIYLVVFVLIVWGTPQALAKLLHTDYPIASVTSSSMWPDLKEGDMVLIKGVASKDDVAIGDIVVYENDRGFTIHRIVEMNKSTLVTKGDANNTEDIPIKYDQLVGKTVNIKNKPFRIPLLGKLSQIIR